MSESGHVTMPSASRTAASSALPRADWLFERFLEIFVYSSLWAAGGLFALTVFSSRVLGLGWSIRPGLLVMFSALFIYNLDHVIDSKVQRIPDDRAQNYFSSKPILACLIIFAVVTGLLAGAAPLGAKIVFASYTVVGLLYGLPLIPIRRNKSRHWMRLKDVPMLKAWLVGVAVTVGVVLLPVAWAGERVSAHVGYLALFMVVFVVSNVHMFDVRDLASDKEHRIWTLPVMLGVRRAKLSVVALNLVMLMAMAWGWARGITAANPEILVATAATVVYVLWIRITTPRTVYGILIDGCLYLPLVLLVVRDVIL